jgi:hypothetical protein
MGSASRADAAPWLFSAVRRPGFFSPICHSLEGPVAPPAGAAGSDGAEIASRFGSAQDPASSGEASLAVASRKIIDAGTGPNRALKGRRTGRSVP